MSNEVAIPQEVIVSKIYEIRGKKVMLSTDLAELYEVESRRINEQVKRNIGRFPERYMFKLTQEEHQSLRSQNTTLKKGGHSKYYVFSQYYLHHESSNTLFCSFHCPFPIKTDRF